MLEELEAELTTDYRDLKKQIAKIEKLNHETPNSRFQEQLQELKGAMRGIMMALNRVEAKMNGGSLF